MSASTEVSRTPSDAEPATPVGSDAAHEPIVRGRGAWVLPGAGSGRSAQLWTLAILGGLLASRLLLFPDGPWEQDEAIFATGVVSFDVPSHQPHPPGFPGWILLGKLLLPLTRDALVALRLWSSICSVAVVWLLARLLAQLTEARAALIGCVALAMSPLVWAHSPRAFSTMPGLALGLTALYLWVYGPPVTRVRAVMGWAVLGFAVTVRPQLVPELGVVALIGLWILRARPALALLGLGVSVLVVVVIFGVAIADSGLDAYLTATRQHFGAHFASRVAARKPVGLLARIEDWGFVRTNGGLIGSSLMLASGIAGLILLFRRNRMLAAWWILLIAITTVMLMFAHSPRAPRYQVALLLVLAGPIVVAFGRLGRAGSLVLGGVGLLGAALGYPALRAMHSTPLPPVAALRAAAANNPKVILYPDGLFSFAKLLDFQHELPTRPTPASKSTAALVRDTYALGGREVRFLPGPNTCAWRFDDFPDAAWELSQKRFDRVLVAQNPVLLGRGVYNVESIGKGRRAAWLSNEATLNLPAPSSLLFLRVEVPKDHAPQRLQVSREGRTLLQQTLDAGRQSVAISLSSCDEQCSVTLNLPDGWTATRDPRTLTVRLLEAWAMSGRAAGSWRWRPDDEAPPAGVILAGFYPPERGPRGRDGRWTSEHAVVKFEATRGTLVLGVRRPEHTPGIVRIATGDNELLPDVMSDPTQLVVRVQGDNRNQVAVSLDSPSFTPAQVEAGSSDMRSLALQLTEMAFYPDQASPCEAAVAMPSEVYEGSSKRR